jgi:NADH-quinone oxidoreductase subunit L
MNQILWLIPVLPLGGFLLNGLLRLPKSAAAIVGCAGPIASFALSVAAFNECRSGVVTQQLFDWITVGEFTVPFGLVVDPLSAVMLLVVTGVGSLIHLYSIGYMSKDESFSRFFAYLNLFMFAMLILVLGDSILLMFVGWEGVGLCSYLLIGFWHKDLKNADAGKKAFIVNRIGDAGFLLGMFCLWQMFGTLEFAKMSGPHGPLAAAACLLLFLGACGKSAQIPLYVWLPDAMAGPTPVSALIHAATMVTAGVYMMARMNFLYIAVPGALSLVVLIAAATAFLAAVIATAQNDIKKILAYSTVSQLGFMFAGIAAADFNASIFHVVTHAFFKALLFLGAGVAIHALHGEQDIRKMAGLGGKLPGLAVVFTAGGLALAGFPFTAGFYSKEEILIAVHGRTGMSYEIAWILLVVTAALTAFYTIRLILRVFLPGPDHGDLHKPGLLMMGPLGILAVLSLVGGFLLHDRLPEFLGFARAAVDEKSRMVNLGASVGAFLLGAGAAALIYGRAKGREWVTRFVEGGGRKLHGLVSNKFFVDEIYEYLVVAPVKTGAVVIWFLVDRILIDTLLVNGTGRLMVALGRVARKSHTGSLNLSTVLFLLGVLAILACLTLRFGVEWN